jgi:hypothetical protein
MWQTILALAPAGQQRFLSDGLHDAAIDTREGEMVTAVTFAFGARPSRSCRVLHMAPDAGPYGREHLMP